MSVPLPRSPRREPDGVAPTKGTRWERFARYAVGYYGGTCHICGHGGARQADHLESVADRPDLAWSLPNIRPAHGAPGNPCPSCTAECGRKVHCNQLRGGYSVTRARRIIAGWAAAHAAGTGTGARPASRPEPESQAGRPW